MHFKEAMKKSVHRAVLALIQAHSIRLLLLTTMAVVSKFEVQPVIFFFFCQFTSY